MQSPNGGLSTKSNVNVCMRWVDEATLDLGSDKLIGVGKFSSLHISRRLHNSTLCDMMFGKTDTKLVIESSFAKLYF